MSAGTCDQLQPDSLRAAAADPSLDSRISLVDAMVISQCVAGASNFDCP